MYHPRTKQSYCFLSGLILFACLLATGVAGAEVSAQTQYSSRQWQLEDGLPHNSVQAITQTSEGYLWIGTLGGLARFDGVTFTKMEFQTSPGNGVCSITALCEDVHHTLWIGTERDGLWCLQQGVLTQFTNGVSPSVTVRALHCDSDQSMWIATSDGLLCFHDGNMARWIFTNEPVTEVLREIDEDQSGNLWFATVKGLKYFSKQTAHVLSKSEVLPRKSTMTFCIRRDGSLFGGTLSGLYQSQNDHISHFTKKEGLQDDVVSALFEDQSTNLWIGTYGGLHRFIDGRPTPVVGTGGESFGRINTLFQDRESNLWIGSRDGLHRLNVKRFSTYSKDQGLSHANVLSVSEGKTGGIWIGTWGGGLNRLKYGTVSTYTAEHGLTSDLILGLCEARNGSLWVGTDFNGGLFHLYNGRFDHYGKQNGLIDSAIRVVYEDSNEVVWLGTRGALYSVEHGKFKRYTTKHGLPGNSIRTVLEDRSGQLWIGTDSGLSRYANGRFTNFFARDGLSDEAILDLHEDDDSVLWIGTAKGGLNKLEKGVFRSYRVAQGLFRDEIYSILEDDHGWLWMSSSAGISRVRKKDLAAFDAGQTPLLHCFSYGKDDGLISAQCNGIAKPSAWKSRDGRLWFCTVRGVAVVDPAVELKPNDIPPPVFVEKIVADKNPISLGAAIPSDSRAIRVPPGRGELEFNYTALSFVAPEKNQFKYKLEGVDRDWVPVGPRRTAYYNNIAPGAYRFRVMACNNDGIWNEAGASVTFDLQPHFWQTWLFKAFAIAFIVLTAGLVYRIRAARLREIQRLRVRIAADLHDEVGSSLGTISLLSRLLQKQAVHPEEKADLATIHRVSTQTANSIRDIVWFINPEYDTIQDLVLRMKDTAGTMLGGIAWRFDAPTENLTAQLPLDFRQNVFLMFKESLANIVKHSQATCVQIRISASGGLWNISIQDNGVGFESARLVTTGNGLKNLRRRAEKMNGTLQIESRPGQGTAIQLSIPMK